MLTRSRTRENAMGATDALKAPQTGNDALHVDVDRKQALKSHNVDGLETSDLEDSPKDEQVDPNVAAEHLPAAPGSPVKAPSSREIAAARAARIRLGYECGADVEDAQAEQGKLPTGPEPDAKPAPEYVPEEEVQPLDNPEAGAATVLEALRTTNWSSACEALVLVRQLTLHHSHLIQPLLADLVPLMLKHIRSPRSQLTKVAILCFGDVVRAFLDQLLPYLDGSGPSKPTDSVICQLLAKAISNEKKFVTEAASQVLTLIAGTAPPRPILDLFLPYTKHKNPKTRGAASECVAQALERLQATAPASDVLAMSTGGLLQNVVTLLTDNTPQARQSSRCCAEILKSCCVEVAGDASKAGAEAAEPSEVNADEAASPWEAFAHLHLASGPAHDLLKATS